MYCVPSVFRLKGVLDIAKLESAFAILIQRHNILRTRFRFEGHELLQLVDASSTFQLSKVPADANAPLAKESEIDQQIQQDILQPFRLDQDSSVRATLIRVGPDEHRLVLALHHIYTDGWSMAVFCRELSLVYNALVESRNPELPSLAVQYADYAVWQKERVRRQELASQIHYWKRKLAGFSTLELPTDRPRPITPTHKGGHRIHSLPVALSRSLKELSQQSGVTLFMTLVAGFVAFLHRYTGQTDILLGTPNAGRSRSELEGLIGFFVNTLILRSDVSGNPSFRDLLLRVREEVLDALSNAEVPFERIVEELAPNRDERSHPLFQVLIVLENTPEAALNLTNLATSEIPLETHGSKFDLSLSVKDTGSQLRISWDYNSDLFDEATIQRMAQHFSTLLEGLSAQPDLPVSAHLLQTESERLQQLEASKGPEITAAPYLSIDRWFEQQADRTPDAMALVYLGQHLSYRELDEKANQLAHQLVRWKSTDAGVVAICLDRSLEMVIAIFATLKAGLAYVAIDPEYPAERIRWMLQDSKPIVVLTQKKHLPILAADGPRRLCMDQEEAALSSFSKNRLGLSNSAEHLAYVLYTSGSTGHPKGAMIPHGAIANHMRWILRVYPMDSSDALLQKTSFSFDASVWEFFAPLLSGGRLVLAAPGGHRDPDYLIQCIRENQITILQLVPSFLRVLVSHDAFSSCTSLRRVFSGGEILTAELVEAFYRKLQNTTLHNLYGPTEATIDSTAYDCPRESQSDPVPIGWPIDNASCYIVDSHLNLVPTGVPGELLIGGAGLALGYWNQPTLTAEKFIPHPFDNTPGLRVYRTGDRCRFRSDGQIEFLGRLDHQVKIRGSRIELGEIELALRAQVGVMDAAVNAEGVTSEDKQLVAYVVIAPNARLTHTDLRSKLGTLLPGHMIPARFRKVAALPLTPSGKLDRNALASALSTELESGNGSREPSNAMERKILEIWKKLLAREDIGIQDNFFELGGHSLIAVKLFSELEAVTGKHLPLATLFRAPTIELFARLLNASDWETSWSSVVPIRKGGSRLPFFCAHGIGGNILEYLDIAKYMDDSQPFYGIQAVGLDGKTPPLESVEAMAEHHLKLIQSIQPEGPVLLGGASFGGMVAYEIAQRLRLQGRKVGLLVLFDTNAPGYPKPLPHIAGWRKKWNRIRYRFQLHWQNFLLSSPSDKWNYVKTKSRIYGKRIFSRRRLANLRRRVQSKFSKDKATLPSVLKSVGEASVVAALAYRPSPYPGKVTLFRATEQQEGYYEDRNLGWGAYVSGEIEVHDIPGHHGAIVHEPRVRVLAQHLKECLAKVGLDSR